MKRILATLILALSMAGLAAGQGNVYLQNTADASSTAGAGKQATALFYNQVGSANIAIEFVFTGGPATTSIPVRGCMRGGTCTIITTVVTGTNQTVFINTIYDYISLTPVFTGGSNPYVTMNYSSISQSAGGASTVSGSPSAVTQAGVPMMCDSATSGTVTAGQAQMVRCNTAGQLSLVGISGASDGSSNSIGFWPGPTGAIVLAGSAPFVFNGANWDRQLYCPNTGKVNALGAATVALVAPVAGKKVRICSFQVSNNNATATTLKIVEGTGATCGTGTTDLTSLINIGATTTTPFSSNISSSSPWVTNVVADGACATSSAASALEITFTWEQH